MTDMPTIALHEVTAMDLVKAVAHCSKRSKHEHDSRGTKSLWSIVWSDDVRMWFHENKIDARERKDHPNETLGRNGQPWEVADNTACRAHPPALVKWRRWKRKGWSEYEVGWCLPEHFAEAEGRAKLLGIDLLQEPQGTWGQWDEQLRKWVVVETQ
jgi:hypothetical protein